MIIISSCSSCIPLC